MDPVELMAEAEELRKMWQAVLDEYATARQEGRPTAELEKLDAAQEKLKDAHLTKAKAAVDAGLAEHSKLPPMSFQEWLAEFRVLHGKARSGELSNYDAKLYKDGREELAAALVQAQRLTRKPEESAREALRVARAAGGPRAQLRQAARGHARHLHRRLLHHDGRAALAQRGGGRDHAHARGKGRHRGAGEDCRHQAAGREQPRLVRFRRAVRERHRAAQHPGGSTRRSRGWAASETGPKAGSDPESVATSDGHHLAGHRPNRSRFGPTVSQPPPAKRTRPEDRTVTPRIVARVRSAARPSGTWSHTRYPRAKRCIACERQRDRGTDFY